MKIKQYIALALAGIMVSTAPVYANTLHTSEEEYQQAMSSVIYEDTGIVVENHPYLGYLIYKNSNGEEITAQYYRSDMVVEKTPYYESEDRIGYFDKLFPHFANNPRQTTIDQVQKGDSIYLRTDKEGTIQYISAYNDYIMRYGKVESFNELDRRLTITDDTGRQYVYQLSESVPVTESGQMSSIGQIKPGQYVKLLVCQKIVDVGRVEEEVVEVAIDGIMYQISDVYRGVLVTSDAHRETIGIGQAQSLGKSGWGSYTDLLTLPISTRTLGAYYMGNPITIDYMNRYLRNTGYLYVAVATSMRGEEAVKLNFQTKTQRTLEPSEVIYTSPGVVRLRSGESLYISEDAIVVKDDYLVPHQSIVVGDTLRTVVTGDNKIAVAQVIDAIGQGDLQIYRGRILETEDREWFEVETFSLLDEQLWYFHPQPRIFTIGYNTRFYDETGYLKDGIEDFLGYGENSNISEVYTVIASGDQALAVIKMPYTTESIKGEVYQVDDSTIAIKDVYVYNRKRERYELYSRINSGVEVQLLPNTMIIKNGEVVPVSQLEPGDEVIVMLDEDIYDQENGATVEGYIITVQ